MTPTTAQSLYRTWRSRTFSEVVGQGHITQTLRNAVRAHAVGHAYLLTGPRGTGKTSTARILARAVNCLQPREGEPCNECAPCRSILQNRCLDIVEIDAASNNSVDDMRDLRDKVNFAPAEVKRKVYIVDECHMLSTSAFNALLKTLEEPPAHVLFLLATTDVHKVPATITSRCQRLDFRIISADDIVDRLAYVCAQEGMQAERSALEIIAQQATGSLRDALSLLEQVRAYDDARIGVAEVEDALGLARRETLARLADSIVGGDPGAALALIGDLAAAGTDMRQYAKQLVQYWRDLLLLRVGSAGASGRPHGAGPGDPAMAALAARLTPVDITAVLKAILQPDYSGRRSASAQWQLELAVVEAGARFAPGETRPADAARTDAARVAASASAPAVAVAASRAQSVTPREVSAGAAPGSSAGAAPVQEASRATMPAAPTPAPAATPVVEAASHDPLEAIRTPISELPTGVAIARMPVETLWETGRAEALAPPAAPAPVLTPAPAQRDGVDGADGADGADLQNARRLWALVRQHEAVRDKRRLNAVLDGSCIPGGLDGDCFVLLFDARDTRSKFMQDQVMAQQNRAAIEEALRAVAGRAVTLRCDTLRQPSSPAGDRAPKTDPFVDEAARRLRAIHMDRT